MSRAYLVPFDRCDFLDRLAVLVGVRRVIRHRGVAVVPMGYWDARRRLGTALNAVQAQLGGPVPWPVEPSEGPRA